MPTFSATTESTARIGAFCLALFGGPVSVSSAMRAGRVHGRPATGYLPALDGMRAIGIILVFVHHMITPLPFGGHVGVDIFFVLSGYLITDILLRERANHGSIRLKRFFIRRAARLYPALLVVLTALLIPGLIFAPSIGKYLLESALAVSYTTPLALQFWNGAAWAWRHTWSLGIEELFYLVWPVLVVTILAKGRPVVRLVMFAGGVGITLLLVALVLDSINQQGSLLLRSGGLFLGCTLAIFFRLKPSLGVPALLGWSGLGLIAGAVALSSVTHATGLPVLLACLGSVAMIGHLVRGGTGILSNILGSRPLAYVGRISYELYLWHYPLLIILSWALSSEPLFVAWAAAPLSVFLAAVTHWFLAPRVERLKFKLAG